MSEIIQFETNLIRRIWNEEEEQWYFAVVDVIEILTESPRPAAYWRKMKIRELKEVVPFWNGFPMKHKKNGRTYQTDCANREGLFRIIQSIPSSKAEPIKQWLAKVANERIEEIQNPELAIERMREIYRSKGYGEEWIEKRLQSIAVRNELTDEWEERGVEQGREYAILTAEISRGTFDLTPKKHKETKGLKRESLRDHMSSAELVFTMLGELSTTEIAREDDAQGFNENKKAAQEGGKIAGDARKQLEKRTGKKVVTRDNFLPRQEKKQLPEDD